MVSDSTIAAVARLHNPALDALSDAEVVQLVAEGRDAHWRPGEPDWRTHYQYALANTFAMAEVVSKLRTDENTKYIDQLIESATEKWFERAEAQFFKPPT
ncbi:hypothetical protein SEA_WIGGLEWIGGLE_111 [Mycobacterium phage Wigglewiggle]|nr:hypothetical protein SEA_WIGGLEWIGGLE_111 [Mycobacterium phage Wigglewiggle]